MKIRPGWARYRADVICLLAIAVLATIFMHRWLRPDYTSLPLNLESAYLPWHGQVDEPFQNLLISDPFHIFYPGLFTAVSPTTAQTVMARSAATKQSLKR